MSSLVFSQVWCRYMLMELLLCWIGSQRTFSWTNKIHIKIPKRSKVTEMVIRGGGGGGEGPLVKKSLKKIYMKCAFRKWEQRFSFWLEVARSHMNEWTCVTFWKVDSRFFRLLFHFCTLFFLSFWIRKAQSTFYSTFIGLQTLNLEARSRSDDVFDKLKRFFPSFFWSFWCSCWIVFQKFSI